MIFKLRLNVVTFVLVISSLVILSDAQYDSQYGRAKVHQGEYSGDGSGSYEISSSDDRPKMQLGIRLRIPAFRFELPRMSLPKITVSAKIKQPEGPRVINLPEINLDTTSTGASRQRPATGAYHGSRGNSKADEQTFSFSSYEEAPVHNYRGKQQQVQHQEEQMRFEQLPQQYDQSHNTGSTGVMDSTYSNPWTYVSDPETNQLNAMTGSKIHTSYSDSFSNGDLGFDAPVYVKPADKQEPIEAYGRFPINVMYQNPEHNNLRSAPSEHKFSISRPNFRLPPFLRQKSP